MPISQTDLDSALAYADAHMDQSLDRLKELIRIKSISTDPAYKAECQRAADWLVADLTSESFSASARPTPGHPVVVAHRESGGRAVIVRDGMVVLAEGPEESALTPVARVPLTYHGRIGFQIENVLADCADIGVRKPSLGSRA